MKKKKALLISLDALSCLDFDFIKKLPNFSKIINSGAYCPNLYSIYPSVTFPAHASIATGCFPASHGIMNNYMFDPKAKNKRWHAFASNLKRRAIWDYANEQGKKVLNMSWPVSAGVDITYSMPEMPPTYAKKWSLDAFFELLNSFKEYGTLDFAADILLTDERLPKAWYTGTQPELDQYVINAFLLAIKKYDFDIGMLHLYGLDTAKHTYGTTGVEVEQCLKRYDDFIGKLLDYIDEKKEKENITIMITGDHGQRDVEYAIYGNMILEKNGLIEYRDGNLIDYKAYMDSGDGMAYIYIKSNEKSKIIDKVSDIFSEHTGIKKVIQKEELKKLGCDPNADMVLEASKGYHFTSEYEKNALSNEDRILKSNYKAEHGYLPTDKDYQTMLFCYGEDIKKTQISDMSIIDILPTLCKWMDIEIDPVDGKQRDIWT